MGRLDRLWIKRFHGGPMDPVEHAALQLGAGIVGNADQGGWRQVTLMAAAQWDQALKSLQAPLDPGVRRANLLVSGIELPQSRNRVLQIGPCQLRVRGETRPCHLMDETKAGLRAALSAEWRGGVFAEVLTDGRIAVGDPVSWNESFPLDCNQPV